MATLNGLLELIERDAVMHAWWTRRRPDVLSWEDLLTREDFRAYESLRGSVSVLDVTTDFGVPVSLAVFQGRNERRTPRLLVAAAAKADETEAIRKSLAELSHLLIRATAGFSARMRFKPREDLSEIRGFFMALLQYHRDESFGPAAFLLESASRRAPRGGGSARLADVVTAVKAQGFEPWVIDRTTADVDALGFKVVRVVVPGLIPLNALHLHRPWGVPRLFTLGKKLGTHDRVLGLDDLNPANHPFP
jgi:ribosomal protein S12 methylthiotransferase accessory factor